MRQCQADRAFREFHLEGVLRRRLCVGQQPGCHGACALRQECVGLFAALEDDVVVGANAVVLEGVRVGKGSVVAAGAIVTENVPEGVVVAGTPARIIKGVDAKTASKTELVDALRNI